MQPESSSHSPENKRRPIDRRTFLAMAGTVLALAGGGYAYEQTHQPSPEKQNDAFIERAASSLLTMHEVDATSGGWKFKSAIQAPHYQTDRDVGASSVGMGFLTVAEQYPSQPQWLNAAEKTATWLTAVSHDDGNGGRFWNDYNDNGEASSSEYTSFDDGTIGIGDFYWRLYEQSHDPEYKKIALESVKWTVAQAESTNDGGYRWKWDASDDSSAYYMGMGMGQAGIVNSLADFYARTKDSDPDFASSLKPYIQGSTKYIESVMVSDDGTLSLSETGDRNGDGGTAMNSGYLSGSAGAAYMYLNLYKTFGNEEYRTKAEKVLNWLGTDAKDGGPRVSFPDGSTAWKISLDDEGGDDARYATGFEEGAAGIGWTYLQAYNVTGDKNYLDQAQQAADWLIKVARKDGNGLKWAEDENAPKTIIHANLNNGAAGIGTFLHDVSVASGNNKYETAAQGALNWLLASAKTDQNGIYWNDNDGENDYSKDPSWHWGTGGIVNAAIRINGGTTDIPGEQTTLNL